MSFVILEQWNVSAQRDEHYGMPILHRDNEDTYFSVLPEVCFAYASDVLKLTISQSGPLLYFQRTTRLPGWSVPTR